MEIGTALLAIGPTCQYHSLSLQNHSMWEFDPKYRMFTCLHMYAHDSI